MTARTAPPARQPKRQPNDAGASGGFGVDARGNPVPDPSQNVLDLSTAANQRQDDLRESFGELVDAKLHRVDDMAMLRDKIAELRAEHTQEIRQLESDRQEKTRQVDVLAAQAATDRQRSEVQVLAATTARDAQTLRDLVGSTAAALAAQQEGRHRELTTRVSDLEKNSYIVAGRAVVTDPALTQMQAELAVVRAAVAAMTGQRTGAQDNTKLIFGIAAFISTLLGIATTVLLTRSP